jgi:hypothetical protein
MNKFEFTALAVGLLLQSLTSAGIATSQEPVLNNGSSVLTSHHYVVARSEKRPEYFLLPDINDLRGEECDPEDDCPRPR